MGGYAYTCRPISRVVVVEAADTLAAAVAAKRDAREHGYRVKGQPRVEYVRAGDMPIRLPKYRVTLTVEHDE